MRDIYHREIDYMRVSVTDRCNLRCRYCMPEGIGKVPMAEVLTYEEITSICRAAAAVGIKHIKVTGGEPLVRRGCVDFIRMLKVIPGIEKVTLTTNGILLAEQMEGLLAAGLDAVNISLDATSSELYRQITGFDQLAQVMAGIDAAVASGIPVKINSVLERGINEKEWKKLILLAKDRPIDVRFIELMPIGYGSMEAGISEAWLRDRIKEVYTDVTVDQTIHGFGPAIYMKIPGFNGSIGFISAVHGKFCSSCNRIRLTATGQLKPCLCYETAVDMRTLVRDEKSTTQLLEAGILQAIGMKPEGHCFDEQDKMTEHKEMFRIGG